MGCSVNWLWFFCSPVVRYFLLLWGFYNLQLEETLFRALLPFAEVPFASREETVCFRNAVAHGGGRYGVPSQSNAIPAIATACSLSSGLLEKNTLEDNDDELMRTSTAAAHLDPDSRTFDSLSVDVMEVSPLQLTFTFRMVPGSRVHDLSAESASLRNRAATATDNTVAPPLMTSAVVTDDIVSDPFHTVVQCFGVAFLSDIEAAQLMLAGKRWHGLSVSLGKFSQATRVDLLQVDEVRWLLSQLESHYRVQLTSQLIRVVGSSGALGNPIGLAHSLTTGFSDLIQEPAKAMVEVNRIHFHPPANKLPLSVLGCPFSLCAEHVVCSCAQMSFLFVLSMWCAAVLRCRFSLC